MHAYSRRELQIVLSRNGYKFIRQTGSHRIYKNNDGKTITIPYCKCNKMLAQRLIKENNLVLD